MMVNHQILTARYDDEMADAELYKKLAEENPEFHQIFCDISREEQTHARWMKFIMEHIEKREE